MSASVSAPSSSGRTRAVLWIALVVVLAVIAAVATVVISQKTYPPAERTVSAKTQVAAGSEYVDEQAGLTFRVPMGWQAESGALLFGSTMLVPEMVVPEDAEAADAEAEAAEGTGLVFIGALTPEMLGGADPTNEEAAWSLATGIGQALLPIPAQPVDEQSVEFRNRVGDGVAVSVRILPLIEQPVVGPEGALIYSAVVGEGDERFWLTYVGVPGDGSTTSPDAAWATEIIKRFVAVG